MANEITFDCFALNLGQGIHDFATDTLKVYLTNVAPSLTDTVYSSANDLATGGGYTHGGAALTSTTWSQISGLASLVAGANLLFTATSGFGPFRYAVLYNFTAAGKNLICYWDNGTSVSVAATKTFGVNFSPDVLTLEF